MNNYHPNPNPDLEEVLAGISPDEAAELRKIWGATASGDDSLEFSDESVDEMRRRVLGSINQPAMRPPIARSMRGTGYQWRFRPMMVACIVVTCLLGTLFLLRPIVVEAPLGQFQSALLPDGSTVVLNSGARLTYPRYWGSKRSVHLEGEAYFNIISDVKLFSVTTFDAEVEVLGTRFNVHAWEESDEPHTTVALSSGRIRLLARLADGRPVDVVPGEVWQVQHANLERLNEADSVVVQRLSSWQKGTLYFQNQPLSVIVDELERRYSTRLLLNIPEMQLRRISFSQHEPVDLQHEPVDLQHVLDNLCGALGVHYRATATGFEIYKD